MVIEAVRWEKSGLKRRPRGSQEVWKLLRRTQRFLLDAPLAEPGKARLTWKYVVYLTTIDMYLDSRHPCGDDENFELLLLELGSDPPFDFLPAVDECERNRRKRSCNQPLTTSFFWCCMEPGDASGPLQKV